jgi:hypothetical protein
MLQQQGAADWIKKGIHEQMAWGAASAMADERAAAMTADAWRSLLFVLLTAGVLWLYINRKLITNPITLCVVVAVLIEEYTEKHDLERDCLWLVYTIGLSDEVHRAAEEAAAKCGFKQVRWIQAGCVITTHGGPAAFGVAGLAKQ